VTGPRRYRAVVAYVGAAFHGWQLQTNAARTVQGVLEEALAAVSGAPVRARAAGRTDAGVHAEGQVVDFELPAARDPAAIRDRANALLPGDLRVLEVSEAEAGFDARRDAIWKEYLYRWTRAAVVPAADEPFVARISRSADPERMRRAALALPGTRDFRVFSVRSPGRESTVRTLHFVRIEERGEEIRALFRGDAFLRGMVRSICGTLAHVARGRLPEDRCARLIETGDRALLASKAPARGLTLLRVAYGGEIPQELVTGDG
jgi:tRNA pseudouridine38-40 synthase